MGEVGLNSSENSAANVKMNGDINGTCEDDEPMDVDSQSQEDSVNTLFKDDTRSEAASPITARGENDESTMDSEHSENLENNLEDGKNQENGSCTKTKEKKSKGLNGDSQDIGSKISDDEIKRDKNKEKAESKKIEVHHISDTDDDDNGEQSNRNRYIDDQRKSLPVKPDSDIEPMEIDGKTNGHITEDEEKPVSIHSDSDDDSQRKIVDKKNGDCKSPEVHEILSDKEDCVVIEDTKLDKLSPRRSTRQRKSVVKVRDFSAFDDDIEEIIEDPLETLDKKPKLFPNATQLSIRDARNFADISVTPMSKSVHFSHTENQNQFNSQKNKEPTLVIIDTNTILAGRGGTTVSVQNMKNINQLTAPNSAYSVLPVGVPAQGIYPPNIRATITPVNTIPKPIVTPQQPAPPQLLPALTDDMFVLEAPSFIVPYIYEKPPSENLKDVINKLSAQIEEVRKKDEEKKKQADVGSVQDGSTQDKSESDKQKEKELKKIEKKKRKQKNPDDSWDESDTSTDEEASDSEQRTKILIKEVKEDLDSIKEHIITPETAKESVLGLSPQKTDPNKKSDNYFDSPLGQFFMTIGINLVQEHVQTDLLRLQKKKRDRDSSRSLAQIQTAINSLMKNLEISKIKNESFKFEMKRCEYCNFKSESALAMANHYEKPHMKGNLYKCNFCPFETRPAHDILFHMEAIHNIKSKLEKSQSYHQCPNCPFEDNGKSKLARHALTCTKKFIPDMNLAPPLDWEPPAKIPRIKPRHGLVGTATAYQAMAAQQQRANIATITRPNPANSAAMRGRGRPQTVTNINKSPIAGVIRTGQTAPRPALPSGMVLPNNYQLAAAAAAATSGQLIQVAGSSMAMLPSSHSSLTIQTSQPGSKSSKNVQQPSISITPLPRQGSTTMTPAALQAAAAAASKAGMSSLKPGHNPAGGKSTFVICEICDGYIKDLDQLRSHMQWIHKVKIHPKMIYNRPPLNCQKCQFRFFTDQGLERHLLGSHGLVTSSMQEAANRGQDSGRCPVCGRVYQWKLLNHVSRDHNMTLKPAHLSYKCTVCTATFGMYKQFENHVYSAHSTVAKKAMDGKKNSPSTSGHSSKGNLNSGDSLLKPLKINDEITIIPQPATKPNKSLHSGELESHIID